MARSVTAYVSKHQRTRVHSSRFTRGEVFTLGANFNACLDGATLAEVVWSVDNSQALTLGAGDITGGLAEISCTAGIGHCRVQALATLSDGRVFSQLYSMGIESDPWFPATGSVTVTA